MTTVVITCGSGGVGKTTLSAALALRLAAEGRRVVVLTIDPARRLADALSVGALDNTPQRVPTEVGHLDALMLDAKRTFDDLIARHAPNADVRDRILKNHYYRFVSERLPGIHEFMAMERLLALSDCGEYDVIVLDTPPARHALDFLTAPDRMAGLMDESVMRWLVLPASAGGWKMLEMGSEMLAGVLKRLLGQSTIEDIADFFAGFQSLWGGFRARSLQVRDLLRGPNTHFVLVTAPAPGARTEALAFLDVLQEKQMPFYGFIVNRCAVPTPESVDWPAAGNGEAWPATTAALDAALARQSSLARTQAAAIRELLDHAPRAAQVWRVPEADHDVHDVPALTRLGVAFGEGPLFPVRP